MRRFLETFGFPICFALFVFHPALQHGMFFDGVTYASISRNLSLGLGSWWAPYYTATLHTQFFENPPVLFWIQSILFRLFGDSVFIEKFYSVAVAVLILGVMKLLIDVVQSEQSPSSRLRTFLLATVLLLATEPYRWGATYSLLDFTLCLFGLIACLLQLRYLLFGDAFSLLLAPLLVALAMGTKGVVGLYPLAFSGLALASFYRKVPMKRVLIASSLCSIGTLGLILMTFYFSPESYTAIQHYVTQHLGPALAGQRTNGTNSFLSVLGWIISSQGIALGAAALLWMTSAKVSNRKPAPWPLWILAGLSASLPMGLSHIFHQFYLIPSLPFFALGLATFLDQNRGEFGARIPVHIRHWGLRIACVALVAISCVDVLQHPIQRDAEDVRFSQSENVQFLRGRTLKTCAGLASHFVLVAYLMRYARISLDGSEPDPQRWQLTGRPCDPNVSAPYEISTSRHD